MARTSLLKKLYYKRECNRCEHKFLCLTNNFGKCEAYEEHKLASMHCLTFGLNLALFITSTSYAKPFNLFATFVAWTGLKKSIACIKHIKRFHIENGYVEKIEGSDMQKTVALFEMFKRREKSWKSIMDQDIIYKMFKGIAKLFSWKKSK